MRRTFAWRNVSRPLLIIAATATIVAIWGLTNPAVFGGQPLTLPFALIAAGVLDFAVYWSGTTPSESAASGGERSTHGDTASTFQDYLAAEEERELRLDEAQNVSGEVRARPGTLDTRV